MTKKLRLLIVEDERPILQGLIDVFIYHGYEVDSAQDGKTGLEKALQGSYDLILLDVMLPEKDGFSVCHEIKTRKKEQPVILLTAKTAEEDVITGLSLGADDYVGKPFSVRELALRVQAVLRRAGRGENEVSEFEIGGFIRIDTLNLSGTYLKFRGEIPFTRKEVDLLIYLMKHPERPVTREELLAQVWGYAGAESIETRTVDIHIAKLRRKIEPDPKNPTYLVTVRGEGYRLDGTGK